MPVSSGAEWRATIPAASRLPCAPRPPRAPQINMPRQGVFVRAGVGWCAGVEFRGCRGIYNMALITSECGTMRSLSIKWP